MRAGLCKAAKNAVHNNRLSGICSPFDLTVNVTAGESQKSFASGN